MGNLRILKGQAIEQANSIKATDANRPLKAVSTGAPKTESTNVTQFLTFAQLAANNPKDIAPPPPSEKAPVEAFMESAEIQGLVLPLLPKVSETEKQDIIKALKDEKLLDALIAKAGDINDANEIEDHSESDKAILKLNLLNTGNKTYDERTALYIADAFYQIENHKDDNEKPFSDIEKRDAVKLLLTGLSNSVEANEVKKSDKPEIPTVVIIDEFANEDRSNVTHDIDGDTMADFTHGELLSTIVRSGKRDVKIAQFAVPEIDGVSMSRAGVAMAIENVYMHQRRGHQYESVILSITTHGFEKKALELDNETIIKSIKESAEENSESEPLNTSIEILSKIGSKSKVYISGGNAGEQYFNPFSLSSNTIGCAAVDKNNKVETYSANNRLTPFKGNGNLVIRYIEPTKTTPGGYDFNNDNQVDVKENDERLSSKKPFRSALIGKTIPEASLYSSLLNGSKKMYMEIMPTADFLKAAEKGDVAFPEDKKAHLANFGDYVEVRMNNRGEKFLYQHGFYLDEKKRLKLDPLKTGDNNIIHLYQGTSFIGPFEVSNQK